MYSQRAIRRLKPDPVPDDLIRRLIEAATKAPSGGNRQPWAFLVIREPATKTKIAEWYLDAWNRTYGQLTQEQRDRFLPELTRVYGAAEHLALHLAEVPVMVLVCATNITAGLGAAASSSHFGSIFPAVQNLLLAARGLGLGASLTTLHRFHEEDVRTLLGIPENVETVALIPIGYPIGRYGPTTRRPIDEVTHFEHWDAAKT
jgi:nitroreductase